MDRRKRPRFAMEQPARLRMKGRGGPQESLARTVNASAGGAYLISEARPALGAEVHLTIILSPRVSTSSNCRVVRVNPELESGKTGVAVECLAPFKEIRTEQK